MNPEPTPLPTEEPTRSILDVLAVCFEEITITDLARVLAGLGGRTPTGKAWGSGNVGAFVDPMIAAGQVQVHGRVSCAWGLREVVARDLVRRGDFARIASVVQRLIPAKPGAACRCADQAIREFRIAFYLGNAVVEAWDAWALAHGCRPLLAVGGALDDAWVAALPAPLLDRLGREVYGSFHVHFAAERATLRTRMEAHVRGGEASIPLRLAWADDLVWSGRALTVQASLVGVDSTEAMILRARAALIRGAVPEARAGFELAEKRMIKEVRQVFDEVSSLFYAAALLATGTPEALVNAREYLGRGERLASPACRDLVLVASHLETGAAPERHRLYDEARRADVSLLFEALARVWMNIPISEGMRGKLAILKKQAVAAGHDWLRDEAAALLGTSKQRSLVDLVRAPEPWRLKLEALARIQAPPPPPVVVAAAETASALRMVWNLTLSTTGMLGFAPREQKLNGTTWTGGRPIALKRLHDNLNDFDYITEQDRRILTTIVRDAKRDYRGYEDVTYSFRGGLGVAAMVGHPLLFLDGDVATPVRLTRGEPVLVIDRVCAELVMRLDPASTAEWAVRRTAPDAIELVTLTDVHRRIAKILEGELRFPAGAEAEVRAIVEKLGREVSVHAGIRGWGARSVEADTTPRIRLSPMGAGIRVCPMVRPLGAEGPAFRLGEGSASVVTRVAGEMVQTERDLVDERERLERLIQACPSLAHGTRQGGDWSFDDEESALSVLLDLARLGDSVRLEWPAGAAVRRVREVGGGSLRLAVRGDGDWFAASGTLQFDDELTLELGAILALLEGSPGRFLALGNGRFAALTEDFRERLELLRRHGTAHGAGVRFHPIVATVVDGLTEGGIADADAAFRTLIGRIVSAETSEPELPSTLTAELRPYQVDGFRWLARLAERGAGACLADDMGLGKTLQALALLVRRAVDGPALVVAPTSVCSGWIDEARRFAPTLDVRRFGDGDREAALASAGPFTVLVCSYGLLQSEADRLAGTVWHTLVLDEAQQIKNSATQRFKAAVRLQADFRMVCSGTPIENHLGELWSLLRFLNPGLFGAESAFRQRFQLPIERDHSPRASAALRRLVRPFVLRRTKSEVLHDLPPRTEVTLQVELGPEEAALYEAIRRRAIEAVANAADRGPAWRFRVLAEITRLRQAACNGRLVLGDPDGLDAPATPASPPPSAKLAALADLIESLREGGHKALIFSQFVRHLAIVRELLDERQIRYQYLDGSTSTPERARAVRAFQAGDGDLFLISLRAGGTGLNLTAADYVIHLDPWWNPAVEDQASDRAHRIGQQRPVTIYRLVSVGTIEERIVALHHAKRDLAANLLDGADGRISAEELVSLLMEGG